MASQTISSGGKQRSTGSQGALGFWAITLGALGFSSYILFNLAGSLTTHRWTQTPCTLLSSQLADYQGDSGGRSFTLDVRYEYVVGGRTYQSAEYNWRGGLVKAPRNWSDYSTAARELERFKAGTTTVCFVDPRDPSRAILVRDDIRVHLLMLGLTAMLWFMLKTFCLPRRPKPAGPAPAAAPEPIALQDSRFKDSRHWLLIGGMCLPMAVFLSWMSIVQPMRESRMARAWVKVPATVVSSDVRVTQMRHGPNYSPDILYAYSFNGREYRANRVAFTDEPESRRATVERTVARYPVGAKTVCFVNPADPGVAVLNRNFKFTLSLGMGVSVFMTGSAVLCLLVGLALRRGLKVPAWILGHTSAAPSPVDTFGVSSADEEPVTLEADTASLGRFLAFLAGAAACFAFVGYMVWDLVPEWRQTGRFEISMHGLLFTVLAGILGFGALAKCWEFFSPQPTLRLSRAGVSLGSAFGLEWTISGHVARLRDLTLALEAREEVIQSQEEMTRAGMQKKEVTLKQVFFVQRLAAPVTLEGKRTGATRVELPVGLMPSFNGQKNKIIWSIAVRSDVKLGPRMDHDFKLRVLPSAA